MTTLVNRKQLRHILLHILAWALYAGFIFSANYLTNPKLLLLPTLLYLLPLCITFYVALYFLNLYKEKGIVWTIASFFIVFFIMASTGYAYVYGLLPRFGVLLYKSVGFKEYMKAVVLGYVQYFSYALLYFYIREAILKERRLRVVEAEKLQHALDNSRLRQQELQSQSEKLAMEYSFLRAQVNPHFLHNSLDVLFSQALEYSEELAANIATLSKIMRYSLEGAQGLNDRVPVEKELEHLRLLISFYKLRFDERCFIQYEIEGEPCGQTVLPLSLITIAENAFKYGDLKDSSFPISINVRLAAGAVYFSCRNKKRINHQPLSSHNIGMRNLQKRLDAAFENQYTIEVYNEDLIYQITLTLNTNP